MGKDRKALTAQIKEANDIVAVVGSYVPLRPAGAIFKGLCPFHNDHNPSFTVDPKWQRYRCWACGKSGDVFTFVQEYDKVDFLEARALLARRAGISLDDDAGPNLGRIRQLEAIKWAAEQYQECLLDMPIAEAARRYLGERKLQGDIVRRFGLGFAPATGEWLIQRASQTNIAPTSLEEVGLIAQSSYGSGWYDRFRDRVMFPVRNATGQIVGFGGRILPGSPLAEKAPKYYNSADNALFHKSELIYGLDFARQYADKAGYLAVVEGYTDVLMAHQHGVPQVVATMGTALNAKHVQQLRRYAPRIVLVFDADAGGDVGVDRALEIFVSQNVELAIATLPEGLDPCDLLIAEGPEPFVKALKNAVDALDFKMNQLLAREGASGVEGQRRMIDAMLNVLALAPDAADQSGQLKRELVVTRISHRLGVREDSVWARLKELRSQVRDEKKTRVRETDSAEPEQARSGRAPSHERELLEILLAAPVLVSTAMDQISVDEITHPGVRQLVEGLYNLQKEGDTPDLDGLRPHIGNPALVQAALDLMEVGRRSTADRPAWLQQVISAFARLRSQEVRQHLQSELTAAADHATGLELLRKLQNQTVGSGS